MEALAPYRAPRFARRPPDPDPAPLPEDAADRRAGALDLTLDVELTTRADARPGHRRRCGSAAATCSDLYWTVAQMVAHHTSNGCNLRPGDLLASGTVSGRRRDSLGSLLEITRRGAEPVTLPTGETRRFLEDGDEVTLRGYCEREGLPRIGLGECTGRVESAR